MWVQTFMLGMKSQQIDNLDIFVLNLFFEFSLEYDIEAIRKAHREKMIEDAKKAPPDPEVMRALGYKVD